MTHLKSAARVLALLAALLAGLACSLFRSEPPVQPATATPGPTPTARPAPSDTRPADFSVTYNWRDGTVAPPYYHEYTLGVAPDGTVTLIYTVDYPGTEGAPVWTETVTLDAAQMDTLYATLVEAGLFTTDWKSESDPPVGGGSDDFSATANGVTVVVPAYVIDSQRGEAEAMATTLTALIPQATWDKLEAQRQEYVDAHSDQ